MGRVELELYSFFDLGARWGGWSTPRPDRFTPGKETRYPLYRRLLNPLLVREITDKLGHPGYGLLCAYNVSCAVPTFRINVLSAPHSK
jgi:hypothetical protein